MPAPTSFNDWDTNGTHTTPVIAGHTTDGFVNNEIPGSAELNQWMMLTGQWTRYLNSLVDFRWHWIVPALGGSQALIHFGGAPGAGPDYVSSSGGTSIDPPVAVVGLQFLPVGAIVSGIGFRAMVAGGGAGSNVTLKLSRLTFSGSSTIETPVFSVNQVLTSAYVDYTFALTTNETLTGNPYIISATDVLPEGNVQIQAFMVNAHH